MRNLLIGIGTFLAATSLLQAQCFDCCPMESDSCSQFYVEGAALIWKPSVHGIPFGVTGHSNSTDPLEVTKGFSCVNKVDFKWNAGFRAGVGYQLPCAGDVGVIWTHFHSTGKGCAAVRSDEFGYFESPWVSQVPGAGISPVGTAIRAFAKWDLKLNLIDIRFEKRIECNRVAITPFASVRGGWIQNRYNINIAKTVPLVGPSAQILCLNSKFQGAGLRGGLEGSYQLCRGFGIYGFGSGSMLYGRYNNQAREFISGIQLIPGDNNDITLCQRDRYCDNLVIGDCGAGIEYKTCFCNDRFALTLQAGWEQNVLFNEVQFTQLPTQTFLLNPQGESHDLSLQGFTFTAKLDF